MAGLGYGGAGLPASSVYLACRGPNDGEPLSSHSEISFDTNFNGEGVLTGYRENRPVAQFRVPAGWRLYGTFALRYRLDASAWPNGPCEVQWVLSASSGPSPVLATARWRGQVENPIIRLASTLAPDGGSADLALGSDLTRVPLRLEGRCGDRGYILVACTPNVAATHSAPNPQSPEAGVRILSLAAWSRMAEPGSDGAPWRRIVLNLANLSDFLGPNPCLVLWTRSAGGQWVRSASFAVGAGGSGGDGSTQSGLEDEIAESADGAALTTLRP
jgi:hypothetical protein